MLDRETTLDKEIFTAIIRMTVMQFDILHSSENIRNIFKGIMAFIQKHIYITMHVQILSLWKTRSSYIWIKKEHTIGIYKNSSRDTSLISLILCLKIWLDNRTKNCSDFWFCYLSMSKLCACNPL